MDPSMFGSACRDGKNDVQFCREWKMVNTKIMFALRKTKRAESWPGLCVVENPCFDFNEKADMETNDK
jgi:hypothetical protein